MISQLWRINIDVSICPQCGGDSKVITSIEYHVVIDKILNHLQAKGTLPFPPSLLSKASWNARMAVEEGGFNRKPGELGRLR